MSDTHVNEASEHSVGDEILVAVHQGTQRSSFFPDQVISITTSAFVELIMLRQELIVRAQTGKVSEIRDDMVHIDFQPQQPQPEMFDIGHVRLAPNAAFDMALTIIAQQMVSRGLDRTEVMQRLQAMTVEST